MDLMKEIRDLKLDKRQQRLFAVGLVQRVLAYRKEMSLEERAVVENVLELARKCAVGKVTVRVLQGEIQELKPFRGSGGWKGLGKKTRHPAEYVGSADEFTAWTNTSEYALVVAVQCRREKGEEARLLKECQEQLKLAMEIKGRLQALGRWGAQWKRAVRVEGEPCRGCLAYASVCRGGNEHVGIHARAREQEVRETGAGAYCAECFSALEGCPVCGVEPTSHVEYPCVQCEMVEESLACAASGGRNASPTYRGWSIGYNGKGEDNGTFQRSRRRKW